MHLQNSFSVCQKTTKLLKNRQNHITREKKFLSSEITIKNTDIYHQNLLIIKRKSLVSQILTKKSSLEELHLCFLPTLFSNRKTETGTTDQVSLEDLPKKLTNHFTALHRWLNLLAHENDIDWSRWFHRNCYFKHCYFYTYSTNGWSIDCRSVQKGDSVKSEQLNDVPSGNSHLPARTAPQLPQLEL